MKQCYTQIMVLALLCSSGAAIADDCPRASRLYHEAKLMKSADSVAKYREAVSICPRFAESYFALGRSLLEQGSLTDARDQFRLAHENGVDAKFALALAFVDLKLGNAAAAEKVYNDILAKNPQLLAAYQGVAAALFQQGKYAESEAALRRAIQLDNRNAEHYFNLGLVLESRRDFDQAYDQFGKAFELRPSWVAPRNHMARSLLRKGQGQEALALLGTTSNSESVDEVIMRISILDSLGRTDEAIKLIEQKFAEQPAPEGNTKTEGISAPTRYLKLNRAILRCKSKKFVDAYSELDSMKAVAEVDHSDFDSAKEIQAARGVCELIEGKRQAARENLRSALDASSTREFAARALIPLASQLGEKTEEIDNLKKEFGL